MWRKGLILILATVSFVSIFIQPALGKEYPAKPIEILVPYAPGAFFDVMSRLVAKTAPKYLGQPVFVVNKPGGSGSVAAAEVISSSPDGYKLFCSTNFYFAANVKTQKLPFDPNHLTPLVSFAENKLGMVVRGDSPWKTFNELLNYGREKPGQLRWGNSGPGVSTTIAALLIYKKAGVVVNDITYKGGTPELLAALLGGHLDAIDYNFGTGKDLIKAGKIRFLVFYSDRRYNDAPDVPSASDLGFPEAGKLTTYCGYFIHKDTPEEIKKTLIDALKKTYEDPGFKKELIEFGNEPVFGGPEFMKEAIRKSEEVSVPILKELGLYVLGR